LDAQGKLVQKSFQRGTTQKFEQAKKMMDEANRKLAEFEQKQREIENKKIFDKEAEELGEETALQRKELREIKEEQARLRWERDQAQQRETSLRIREDFRQVVPKFHIPQEQVFEDFILSRIVAGDMIRVGGEEPPRDIEESAAQCADMLGLTNVENLWKIIRANPENELAVKNFYINNYVKEKAKGPTVSPSSTANVQTPKPPADTKDSMDADVRAILGLQPGEQIILT
jgi:predicted nuclease with TOPRIM domain